MKEYIDTSHYPGPPKSVNNYALLQPTTYSFWLSTHSSQFSHPPSLPPSLPLPYPLTDFICRVDT